MFLISSTQLNWHFYLWFWCVCITDGPESKGHTGVPRISSGGWLVYIQHLLRWPPARHNEEYGPPHCSASADNLNMTTVMATIPSHSQCAAAPTLMANTMAQPTQTALPIITQPAPVATTTSVWPMPTSDLVSSPIGECCTFDHFLWHVLTFFHSFPAVLTLFDAQHIQVSVWCVHMTYSTIDIAIHTIQQHLMHAAHLQINIVYTYLCTDVALLGVAIHIFIHIATKMWRVEGLCCNEWRRCVAMTAACGRDWCIWEVLQWRTGCNKWREALQWRTRGVAMVDRLQWMTREALQWWTRGVAMADRLQRMKGGQCKTQELYCNMDVCIVATSVAILHHRKQCNKSQR